MNCVNIQQHRSILMIYMALLSRHFNRKTSVCLLETQHWTRPSILFHFRSFLFLAVVFRLLSQWKSCGTSRSRQARGVAIYMANMTVVHRASRSIAQRQARHRRHRTGPGGARCVGLGPERTGPGGDGAQDGGVVGPLGTRLNIGSVPGATATTKHGDW